MQSPKSMYRDTLVFDLGDGDDNRIVEPQP